MKKIYVFSGTTEGREISEFLSDEKMEHEVYVATEYGEVVMTPSSYAHVNTGRLDIEDITNLFNSCGGIVVDATHPFATIVTDNIKKAIEKSSSSVEYLRVQRDIDASSDTVSNTYGDSAVVNSTEEAIEILAKTQGNIMLTTGVKTIKDYVSRISSDRIYARILPSVESLTLALESGLKPKQIIAMEGPFSVDINEALIEQFDIDVLVTKNSGARGGFIEKLEACKNKGIKAIIINPQFDGENSNGLSVEETKKELCKLARANNILPNSIDKEPETITDRKIVIAGVGVGNDESMTIAAFKIIKDAQLIIGAKRMVEIGASINQQAETKCEYKTGEIVNIIKSCNARNIVILVSGDSGFYSLATSMNQRLTEEGYTVKILPAVSSISYFCSKIGVPYSEASLISNHGQNADIYSELIQRGRVFSIVSGVEDVNSLINEIITKSSEKDFIRNIDTITFYVGFNLGLSNEQIDKFKVGDIKTYTQEGLYVLGASLS